MTQTTVTPRFTSKFPSLPPNMKTDSLSNRRKYQIETFKRHKHGRGGCLCLPFRVPSRWKVPRVSGMEYFLQVRSNWLICQVPVGLTAEATATSPGLGSPGSPKLEPGLAAARTQTSASSSSAGSKAEAKNCALPEACRPFLCSI